MDEALLSYVALPFTQEVVDILNFLSIPKAQYLSCTKFTEIYGLFIYPSNLELEVIERTTEWVINDEDVPTVLAMYANKDFNGICEYLNNIPERPFDVYINSAYLT